MVRLLLPFILGICLSFYLDFYWLLLLIPLLVFLAGMFVLIPVKIKYKQRWLFGILASLAFILLGSVIGERYDELSQQRHFSHFLHADNILLARIIEVPQAKKRVQTTLKIFAIQDSLNNWQPVNGKLLAYIDEDLNSMALQYGDVIALKGWIRKVDAPKNPDQFDYKTYLARQNIYYQAFLKKGDWAFANTNEGEPVLKIAYKVRQYCIEYLRKILPSDKEFSVGSALVLGYKAEISDDVRAAYSQTGAMHVLAVSGLHVGLVYLFLHVFFGAILRSRYLKKWLKPILTILGVWGFALLTGMSPSVLRAATMFSFIIVGQAMSRYTNIYNTLAASAFFLLCFNPYLIVNVGFQLSYLAVIGIVYFQPRIYRLWLIDNPVGDKLWALTAVSIAAQLGTFPLTLYYFHQFPLFFWLASLIVVPAATFILGLGLLSLITSWIPIVGAFIGKLLYVLIWIVNALIFSIQQIPFSLIEGIWISASAMLLLYGLLICLSMYFRKAKAKWLIAGLSILLLLIANRSYKMIQEQHQKKLVVYHNYKNSVIDAISGNNTTVISSTQSKFSDLSFVNKNHQEATGVKIKEQAWFQGNHMNDYLFLQQDFIRFHDKNIFVLNKKGLPEKPLPVKIDYVLIQNSPFLKMSAVQQYFQSEILVFDGSNSRKAVRIWKRQCEELGIKYYDTQEDGAWISPYRRL